MKLNTWCILVSFQDGSITRHTNGKLSPRPCELYDWTLVYLEKKIYPRFIFILKTGKNSLKQEVPEFCFCCVFLGRAYCKRVTSVNPFVGVIFNTLTLHRSRPVIFIIEFVRNELRILTHQFRFLEKYSARCVKWLVACSTATLLGWALCYRHRCSRLFVSLMQLILWLNTL